MKFLLLAMMLTMTFTTKAAGDCIAQKDLADIADHYSQFTKYLSDKSEVCEGDMDEEFFKIARSIIVLKNISPNLPSLDRDDAMTFQAIEEKDWWSYFTNRSDSFSIDRKCQEGVVAYVNPFFGRGVINLCLRFFDMSVPSQASVMMHEVRHFDGFRHVTCTQGNEQGSRGACDKEITDKGSYGISVQVMVGLARGKSFSKSETNQLESEAIYMAFNKFNKVPEVKLNYSMILANKFGEVYKWAIGQGVTFMKTLSEPAVINGSERNLTIYPVDASVDAYRMDLGLNERLEGIGLFAEHYNKESVSEREKYKSINYHGASGLLKENTLLTLCNIRTYELGEENLNRLGQFTNLISLRLSGNGPTHEAYLLNDNGDLFTYSCDNNRSTDVTIRKANVSLGVPLSTIKQTLTLGNTNFAVLESGELVEIMLDEKSSWTTRQASLPSSVNENWISASPIIKAEVF